MELITLIGGTFDKVILEHKGNHNFVSADGRFTGKRNIKSDTVTFRPDLFEPLNETEVYIQSTEDPQVFLFHRSEPIEKESGNLPETHKW